MNQSVSEAASKEQWTLLRGARQLLTLRGASGPRRGAALNELSVVKDGALLLCNGVIQEAGTSRRVENLKNARHAREIDVAGKVVMPAFVDPDAVLIYPPAGGKRNPKTGREARLGVVSKHRLAQIGVASAADWVRAGVLSVGAHTGSASDQRDALRILRIHQSLQSKPLRIRSVYSPLLNTTEDEASPGPGMARMEAMTQALAVIRKRKLAGLAEFLLEKDSAPERIRQAALAATEAGYSVRMRICGSPEQCLLLLALEASAIALIAPPIETVASMRTMVELGNLGCVHVIQVTNAIHEGWTGAKDLRREIDMGIPVAITSGFRGDGVTSLNPQYLLHLAVECCGMTVEEAIVASTYNAACSLRMSHVTGSLEPGKAADLLVMDVSDYRDLTHRVGHNDVQAVIRSGHIVYRRGALTVD